MENTNGVLEEKKIDEIRVKKQQIRLSLNQCYISIEEKKKVMIF